MKEIKEEKYSISKKAEMMCDKDYPSHIPYPYKINAWPLQYNTFQDCYREQLVSHFQFGPMIKYTVPLKEADYILYTNPFARVEDFSESVLKEIEWISKNRKKGAEIIIMGKACNIKEEIEGKYENITYVPSHYAKYVGDRFGFDIEDKFIVYDDKDKQLNLWPVDGCERRCGFCRRTYMHIPFESVPLEEIKRHLDWFKVHHPEQMRIFSLRAENLTEYGLDIYGRQRLDEVIDLIDRYDEIEEMEIPIGMCIGEINDKILASLCRCKKLKRINLNLEAGTNRLLKVIGKNHTREKAIEVCDALVKSNPNISIDSTVMIGLPTEGLEDVIALGDLIIKCHLRELLINYYGYSPKHPLAKYPQITKKVRELHLAYLLRYLKNNYQPENNNYYPLSTIYEKIEDKRKRSVYRHHKSIQESQKHCLPRIYSREDQTFVGFDISIKGIIEDQNELRELIKSEVLARTKSRN